MAKVSYIDIDVPLQGLYFAGLKQADRFFYSRVVLNRTILSRKNIKGLTARSLLPQLAESWSFLSDEEKQDWKDAGSESSMTGYRAFVKDNTLRIKQGLPGVVTPSLLHQARVGNLHIEAPATELKILQLHPHSYWVSSPIRGKKGMRELVEITEDLALPLKISLNYSSNLSAAGPDPWAKFYAQVWSSYQGVDRYTQLEISFDLVSDWKNAEATLSQVIGHLIGYQLVIHLHDLQGDLYFDNVKVEHSGQNWCRDTFCNDINQAFTKAFFQVPKHWVADIAPDGSNFESIYKDF
ncbi:MAG: hypothetical protein PHN89_04320 [Candidatus Pacebacteria bacterium]|jgi:hypothetical protein|nr:hypothetical protein [Candidatus Paceibacterota bacterium]